MKYKIEYTNEYEIGFVELTEIEADSIELAIEKVFEKYGNIGIIRIQIKNLLIKAELI